MLEDKYGRRHRTRSGVGGNRSGCQRGYEKNANEDAETEGYSNGDGMAEMDANEVADTVEKAKGETEGDALTENEADADAEEAEGYNYGKPGSIETVRRIHKSLR